MLDNALYMPWRRGGSVDSGIYAKEIFWHSSAAVTLCLQRPDFPCIDKFGREEIYLSLEASLGAY